MELRVGERLVQTHPVNIRCGKKPEYPERKPRTFSRASTNSFHASIISPHRELNLRS